MKISHIILRRFLWSITVFLMIVSSGFAQVVHIPDTNLQRAIQEELGVVPPFTPEDMTHLTKLHAIEKGIVSIQGLEFAVRLTELDFADNPIKDISPLVGLMQLTHLGLGTTNLSDSDLSPLASLTSLVDLDLGSNYISDLSPLSALTFLRKLDLQHNQISDISPLAVLSDLRDINLRDNPLSDLRPLSNLTNLESLELARCEVTDVSPLANLANLRVLDLRRNQIRDFTPLSGLKNLTDFQYDEICEILPLPPPITERIGKRTFPSVVQAWDHLIESTEEYDISGYIYDEPLHTERISKHDLYFSPSFRIGWPEPWYGLSTWLTGDLDHSQRIRQQRLALNPNLVSLKEIRVHNYLDFDALPPDSDFWVREADGSVQRNTVAWPEYNFNILLPEVQELLVNRIVGIAECGLYDGIFIDGFFNQGAGYDYNDTASAPELIEAHAKVLEGVRERVREDFLILVNANRTKLPRHKAYVNGAFMELNKDYPGGYTYKGLQEIENTLSWSEANLRSPQINCVEGEAIGTEPPDSQTNKRWMRVFTTMCLTHSDGYILFKTGRTDDFPHHAHIWYDFWDADLGYPVGEKAQLYENQAGLFIREFTNGWAVYNRSGKPQDIQLPEKVSGWASGVKNKRWHTLPDLDGEIYLKSELETPPPADVNADGVVNILDLVVVANAFGEPNPDVNGDGTVNVLDLVIVANAFE